ncbi:acetoin utilization AcuB family protein [Pseudoneobacillus rhizosphaerae]|uniref:Inosine-5'-monophosphate dehydrogenase n=1 Tax=Pseudoneobacillus rhizosphaerae TaxID=2880968 RepID=A0A9C7GAL1_9BACI|nr:acetoin utilization AcuB family protein [Pseudoneobacillus rhizosphaerae]CAG9608924.1 Inosine-5'-monophosphate dehydrogenase [Pseudoneobacillus rhizosphaerae]
MIVEEIMNSDVAYLTPTDSISQAILLMASKKIRHIPIIDHQKHVVGLITDRDIKDAAPSIFRANDNKEDLEKPLSSIMKVNVITGHPLDFVEEIAALFYEHKISCMPIIKDQCLVGIVTETDLLHTLVELTGAHQPGSQIEVKVPNKAGMLLDITAIIKNHKANIQSVLVYPDKKDINFKIIVIRVQTMNPVAVIKDLKLAGHTVLWPNLPGVSS